MGYTSDDLTILWQEFSEAILEEVLDPDASFEVFRDGHIVLRLNKMAAYDLMFATADLAWRWIEDQRYTLAEAVITKER